MPEIRVIINKSGTAKMEVNGIQGPGCEKHIRAVQEALGGKVQDEETKDSFYCATSQTETETTGW